MAALHFEQAAPFAAQVFLAQPGVRGAGAGVAAGVGAGPDGRADRLDRVRADPIADVLPRFRALEAAARLAVHRQPTKGTGRTADHLERNLLGLAVRRQFDGELNIQRVARQTLRTTKRHGAIPSLDFTGNDINYFTRYVDHPHNLIRFQVGPQAG